jgi:predicted dithiol-disulfide oxidoreductase (DUF899 family)
VDESGAGESNGINGVAHHIAQNVDFAIVAAADPAALRAHARARGWNRLRLLSTRDSTFKYDLGSEDREGNQASTISVFTGDSHGAVHHFYTAHPWMSPEIKERGIDLMSPIWHVLDLTRRPRRGRRSRSLDEQLPPSGHRAPRVVIRPEIDDGAARARRTRNQDAT